MENNNRINVVALSNYSEYDSSKCRNGGAYGYDYIYTYSRDSDSFMYEWMTTCELVPDAEASSGYSLEQVLADMADFIRRNANTPNCTIYVNGICVWESTPIGSHDMDESGLYFNE